MPGISPPRWSRPISPIGRPRAFPGAPTTKSSDGRSRSRAYYQRGRRGTGRTTKRGNTAGPVDVYIEDGRHGEYGFVADHGSCRAIWNRHRHDGRPEHQAAIAGVTNYAYVKIKNRGWKPAAKVVVRAFQATASDEVAFPGDWQPMQTAQRTAGKVPPKSSSAIIAGPFAWTPAQPGRVSMLMAVSAAGDATEHRQPHGPRIRSRIGGWCRAADNIAQRNVTVATAPHQRRGRQLLQIMLRRNAGERQSNSMRSACALAHAGSWPHLGYAQSRGGTAPPRGGVRPSSICRRGVSSFA